MKIKWQYNNYFREKFIVIGDWDFQTISNFSRCKFISADTETKLYYKNDLLSEEQAYDFYKLYGAKWCRQNIIVKAYAFTISDGKNFALFQNIEDFLLCCATMLVEKVFWYNAKFDFALFDYYFETNNWITSDNKIIENNGWKKLPHKTYQSLNGDFGQRYQLRIWQKYKNRHWNNKVHNFKMLDICNIFHGGLRKNLIDWNIIDDSGQEVRKLNMDYVNASIENDIEYMINDTKGLHLLAIKIDETIKRISGFSLFDGDYITAGGLAKKSLLKFMFKNDKMKENLELFRYYFPMSVEQDKEFRDFKLYQGGKCFINPYKRGKIINKIYKYDINSMYPTQMRNMLYPIGEGKIVNKISKDKLYVLKITNIIGHLKNNMTPVWYDTLTGNYISDILDNTIHYIWLEELKELENYYNLSYKILEIKEYNGRLCKGAKDYVDNYYDVKKNNKGAIREGAKLFLNSAYGKLAERIETIQCDYKLSEDGYIHLVKGETKIDEKKIMSVLLGSRITSLARTSLMYYIRTICKNNPKKYFVYCDTDSVHSLCEFKDTDDKELGKMKNEGIYEYGKYIAPKTYMLYNNLDKNDKKYEIHCKGVNVSAVEKEIEKCKNFEEASNIFVSGKTFKCLTSLNCIGGKALIYIDKMLLNPKMEQDILDDDEIYTE